MTLRVALQSALTSLDWSFRPPVLALDFQPPSCWGEIEKFLEENVDMVRAMDRRSASYGVLVGTSGAGKTRCQVEAVRAGRKLCDDLGLGHRATYVRMNGSWEQKEGDSYTGHRLLCRVVLEAHDLTNYSTAEMWYLLGRDALVNMVQSGPPPGPSRSKPGLDRGFDAVWFLALDEFSTAPTSTAAMLRAIQEWNFPHTGISTQRLLIVPILASPSSASLHWPDLIHVTGYRRSEIRVASLSPAPAPSDPMWRATLQYAGLPVEQPSLLDLLAYECSGWAYAYATLASLLKHQARQLKEQSVDGWQPTLAEVVALRTELLKHIKFAYPPSVWTISLGLGTQKLKTLLALSASGVPATVYTVLVPANAVSLEVTLQSGEEGGLYSLVPRPEDRKAQVAIPVLSWLVLNREVALLPDEELDSFDPTWYVRERSGLYSLYARLYALVALGRKECSLRELRPAAQLSPAAAELTLLLPPEIPEPVHFPADPLVALRERVPLSSGFSFTGAEGTSGAYLSARLPSGGVVPLVYYQQPKSISLAGGTLQEVETKVRAFLPDAVVVTEVLWTEPSPATDSRDLKELKQPVVLIPPHAVGPLFSTRQAIGDKIRSFAAPSLPAAHAPGSCASHPSAPASMDLGS